MKLFLTPLAFIVLLNVSAQSQTDTIERFYDINRNQVKNIKDAAFYSVFVLKDSLWCESAYNWPRQDLLMYGCYHDSLGKISTDTFYYTYPLGEVKAKGKYINGKKEGAWLSYYMNGMIKDSCNYSNDIPVNVSLSWHNNGSLCDSVTWNANNGVALSWSNTGNFIATGIYNLQRKQHGAWKYYYSSGKVASAEYYEYGELRGIQTFDEQGNLIPNQGVTTKLETESTFPDDNKGGWKRYLQRNLHYPKEAFKKGVKGMVVIGFEVDALGNVKNVEALAGPEMLTGEAIRLVVQSGKWLPARYHNVPVRSYKKQPIVFRLGRGEKEGDFSVEKWKDE